MSPQVYLSDVEDNPTDAVVDGITLVKGDTNNPTDLTEDQVERLRAADVKLQAVGEQEDPFDSLQGEALDNAVREADIEGWSSMRADEKRQALKDQRDAEDTDDDSQ